MTENAFQIENISKKFTLYHEQRNSLRENLFRFLTRRERETFYALKDISFTIPKGEFFGIIGRNGSGKSTLLKMLAGVYKSDTGKIHVNGKISPFLELGVGFNGELTARENIFLNGAILGLSKKEIQKRFESIIQFAELEKFTDTQLKHFSSGMYVRLAFALAIQVDADILIMDEVLAVGDANFQEKCYDIFEQLKKKGKTIIFVSHALDNVKRFCNRVALLEYGQIEAIGEAEDVIEHYQKLIKYK